MRNKNTVLLFYKYIYIKCRVYNIIITVKIQCQTHIAEYLSEHTPLRTVYGDLKCSYISKITIVHWLFIIKNTFVFNKVQFTLMHYTGESRGNN